MLIKTYDRCICDRFIMQPGYEVREPQSLKAFGQVTLKQTAECSYYVINIRI